MPLRTRLALVVVALSGACGSVGCGSPSPEPGEVVGHNASALNANDMTAFYFFVGKGLSSFQSAGIVGNLDQESNDDPTAIQYGGGPGRGIAQWSVGGRWDTDSMDNVLWYAGVKGESSTSLNLQLEFIWYELTTFSSYGLSALKSSANVTDATIAFQNDFEGCGTCDESNRIAYAEAVLAAYGSFSYGAEYVSQSFPLASTTLTMMAGQIIPSYIELKNIGSKNWDSNTRLGTTEPRDRSSAFADSTWINDHRPAGVMGTVVPGDSYKFSFDLHAPMTPGLYDEHFGVVEEGVAWFSDMGQGGPPDNQLEVKIQVMPGPTPPPVDGGAPGPDAGVLPPLDAGADAVPEGGRRDGGSHHRADGGGGESPSSGAGGCSVSPTSQPHADASWMHIFGLGLAGLAIARRWRRRMW